ncbi:MAG: DUF177 domain-containing protein [Rhodobacteraceae bacterium]|nr:MAG: DUF177 domain-containing protein [Paracoccaceae bacterium]
MPHSRQTSPHALQVSALPQNRPQVFEIVPDAPARAVLAEMLGLSALRKLRFVGEIRGTGKHDFVLTATLGATVVQPCVQTLAPVTTRIDAEVERRFLADWETQAEAGSETEMPEDDTIEPLGALIDPWAVMVEALVLEIPDYPRAPDAPDLGETVVTEPGKTPLREADTKPFAGLAGLRDRLSDKGDEG